MARFDRMYWAATHGAVMFFELGVHFDHDFATRYVWNRCLDAARLLKNLAGIFCV